MIVKNKGIYRAKPISAAVNEDKTVQISYQILQVLRGSGWVDISSEGLEFTQWLYLAKKDGTLNGVAFEQLEEAMGWDGVDLKFFAGDLPEVQITIGYDKEGKYVEQGDDPRLKVKWLNHYNYTPNKVTYSDAAAATVMNDLEALMLARAGTRGSVSYTPPVTESAPATEGSAATPASTPSVAAAVTPASPAAAPPVAASNAPGLTRDEAWQKILEASDNDQQKALTKWHAAVKDQEGESGRTEHDFAPQDWAQVADDLPF